jgi:hypothetical protein
VSHKTSVPILRFVILAIVLSEHHIDTDRNSCLDRISCALLVDMRKQSFSSRSSEVQRQEWYGLFFATAEVTLTYYLEIVLRLLRVW